MSPESGIAQEHLLTLADEALYRAKASGRNRLEMAIGNGLVSSA